MIISVTHTVGHIIIMSQSHTRKASLTQPNTQGSLCVTLTNYAHSPGPWPPATWLIHLSLAHSVWCLSSHDTSLHKMSVHSSQLCVITITTNELHIHSHSQSHSTLSCVSTVQTLCTAVHCRVSCRSLDRGCLRCRDRPFQHSYFIHTFSCFSRRRVGGHASCARRCACED